MFSALDYDSKSSIELDGLTVSEALDLFNQVIGTSMPIVSIVGEVANFKINQGKWVFFDIKDNTASLSCFMSVFALRTAIEDGMQVAITAKPNITKWGKFSLTIQTVKPVGHGSIKKSFELLKKKLASEGLFKVERKRPLPNMPEHIGVISSLQAAGYSDFIKIANERIGGLTIDVIPVQVQGDKAPDQIINAISQFNQLVDPPQVIAILRGGGSRDDLAAFDDEKLVRAIAGSRQPVITGIGHEIDTTLADLAADQVGSTPSNVAQILLSDKSEVIDMIDSKLSSVVNNLQYSMEFYHQQLTNSSRKLMETIDRSIYNIKSSLDYKNNILKAYDPQLALKRGYAILWDSKTKKTFNVTPTIGKDILVETDKYLINAKVNKVDKKLKEYNNGKEA